MRIVLVASVLLIGVSTLPAFCADVLPTPAETPAPTLTYKPIVKSDAILRPDSIFLFGGALSTTALGPTLKFNLDQSAPIKYDNYIVGAAYNHDFYKFDYGITLGAEVGIADRFGQYERCCDTIVKTSGLVNSGELWFGPRFSNGGFVVFDSVRISGAISTGLSFTTNSIGRERDREIGLGGNGRMLLYFGPEIIVSMVNHPEFDFVYRLHHRSGADGTFGKLYEGYNANVFGIRYKF